jgi:hypothetical protein
MKTQVPLVNEEVLDKFADDEIETSEQATVMMWLPMAELYYSELLNVICSMRYTISFSNG